MLLQITGGNEELASERLKLESGFESKKDKKWVEGKENIEELKGKWLNFVYGKVKKIYDKQFPDQEPSEEKPEEKEKK